MTAWTNSRAVGNCLDGGYGLKHFVQLVNNVAYLFFGLAACQRPRSVRSRCNPYGKAPHGAPRCDETTRSLLGLLRRHQTQIRGTADFSRLDKSHFLESRQVFFDRLEMSRAMAGAGIDVGRRSKSFRRERGGRGAARTDLGMRLAWRSSWTAWSETTKAKPAAIPSLQSASLKFRLTKTVLFLNFVSRWRLRSSICGEK